MSQFIRHLGVLLIATAAGVVFMAATPGRAAASLQPAGRSSSRAEDVQVQLQRLSEQGASDNQIEKQTGLVLVSSSGSSVEPASSSSIVAVSTPKVYYDGPAKSYYATASWKFSSAPDRGEGLPANIGGLDGFALRFSQEINNINGTLRTCITGNLCRTETNYASNSQYGVSWRFQDSYIRGGFYSHTSGSMTFAFKRLHGGCLQAFTSYAHTWSSTSISGFAINSSGFGISWTKSNNHWDRASSAGKIGC